MSGHPNWFMAAEVLQHYRALGGTDAVCIEYLEKQAANGKGEPDPTVEAINALRSAVVAQTALLRSMSEQIRLGQAATNGALDGLASTIGHFYGDSGEALAGLAERLDKQAEGRSVANSLTIGSLNAIEGRLAAIEAKLAPQPTVHEKRIDYGEHCNCRSCKEYRASQSKQNQSLTRKKSKHGKAKR